MSGYTYQQLEVILERARALGMDAEIESRASDPEEPYLMIHQIAGCGSLTYFLDVGRFTELSGWGSLQAYAAEIDAVHATLTADFAEAAP